MKLMSKLQKRKEELKKDNKGFSLVELIIVIAIMAILVGIVGTQVIPYLNKSKESKDLQIVNSYSTAAVSAYSMLAGDLTTTTGQLEVKVYGDAPAAGVKPTTDKAKIAAKIQELVGYSDITDLWDATNKEGKMTSTEGRKVTEITITYNLDTHTVETAATGTELDKVKADI